VRSIEAIEAEISAADTLAFVFMKRQKSLGHIARGNVRRKYAGWQPVAEITYEDWQTAARAVEREVLKRLKAKKR